MTLNFPKMIRTLVSWICWTKKRPLKISKVYPSSKKWTILVPWKGAISIWIIFLSNIFFQGICSFSWKSVTWVAGLESIWPVCTLALLRRVLSSCCSSSACSCKLLSRRRASRAGDKCRCSVGRKWKNFFQQLKCATTSWKTNMTMETQPLEDVFPTSQCHVSFWGVVPFHAIEWF